MSRGNKDYFDVEEYVKGSDYAPIFEKQFKESPHIKVIKDGKSYTAGASPRSDHYVVSKKFSWLRASRKWLIENGWELSNKPKGDKE